MRRRDYQRQRRLNLSKEEKHYERVKARKRMKKFRDRMSKKELNANRIQNKERRYLKRLLEKHQEPFHDKMDVHQYNFEYFQKNLHWYECLICKKRQIVSLSNRKPCKNCMLFSGTNDMDPGSVPHELQGLSFVERQLIARIHPVLSVYQVKKCQFRYKGNVINFPQDVQEVANILPHTVKGLKSIVTFSLHYEGGFKEFNVRRKKVIDALVWLKRYNPLYADVEIDIDRCNLLPDDGDVSSEFSSLGVKGNNVDDDEVDDVDEEVNDITGEEEINDEISFTDVPDLSEVPQKDQIENGLYGGHFLWPSIGKVPVNEFGSPGYIGMAFPSLFPYGRGDYSMPRSKNVKLSDYIRHLMLYQDGRFAKDERFRYFLMNSQMRWNCLNSGNVFIKKNSFFSKLSVMQLKVHLKSHPEIAKQIMFYSSRIRTTPSYWNSRCGELLDMVKSVGIPSLFFTLSSADYHWPYLYTLLGYDVNKLSISQKMKLVSENPLVCDTFFSLRCKFFLEKYVSKKLPVKDFWYRYEYQHRGSIHVHGVLWLDGAPDVTNVESESSQKLILEYFDDLISCTNPDPSVNISGLHPCSKRMVDVEDLNVDLAELVNRVQRHTECSKKYCLRVPKGSKKLKCRYKFPLDLCDRSKLVMEGDVAKEIIFKRDDPRVNRYNKDWLQTWRANMDLSAITSESAIYHYIAKYASKCESKSLDYCSLLKRVSGSVESEDVHCRKVIRKFLMTTCARRDYCAQEVMHYLMGYHFYESSRKFVVLNARSFIWDGVSKGMKLKSILEVYSNRPSFLNDYPLYHFVKHYEVQKLQLLRRKRPAVVRVFPKLNVEDVKCPSEDSVDCLMVFFVPWRKISSLSLSFNAKCLLIEERKGVIFESVCGSCRLDFEKFLDDLEGDEIFTGEVNDEGTKDELCSFHPKSAIDHRPCILGKRSVDKKEKWDSWDCELDESELNDLYGNIVQTKVQTKMFELKGQNLTNEQTEVLSLLKVQVSSIKKGLRPVISVVVVQGGAGTGKSYLLKRMYNYVSKQLGSSACRIVCPTGVAARNVDGQTIHSFLRLSRLIRGLSSLVGEELSLLQSENKDLSFLFVDEYSMIGCRFLAAIEDRLKQIKGSKSHFGGLCIYFFGDVKQLIPVGDTPLFADISGRVTNDGLLERGKLLLQCIEKSFFLRECHRSKDKGYIDFLDRLSNGTCNESDLRDIRRRCLSVIGRKEQALFKNSMKLCGVNPVVDAHNIIALESLEMPVAIVKSQNNCKEAFESGDDLSEGLPNVLYLSIGAVVMLRRNLNTSRSLVNGTIGRVKCILYAEGKKPPMLPRFVVIQFEGFKGSDLEYNFVPIRPVVSHWLKGGVTCRRVQLPLCLAWSCTIHKAQSLSLLRIVIDLTDCRFDAMGLMYVAFSRVSNFESLCLMVSINLDRLNSVRRSKLYNDRNLFLEFLEQLL